LNSDTYFRGLNEFNQEAFFHAHEAFEEAWRTAPAGEKKFLQALVQLAVAFHHFRRGNVAGARSVMKRAGQNLASYPGQFSGVDLIALRQSIGEWQQAIGDGSPVPPLPKL
jgi:predicted metal-dependent hydrolase